jgi:predicted GNAT superfamily acetyltransferase
MNNEHTLNADQEITIRRAATIADYHACQDAQRQAWSISDDSYIVPIATMVGANLHGGLVLGAFLPDGAAVAMSFAFLGRVENRLCLYSQLT